MNKTTFKNKEELQELIDKYFISLEPEQILDDEGNVMTDKSGVPIMSERKPATVASLAYAIGLTSKTQLLELQDNKKYSFVVKRALLRTEAYMERLLFDKSASSGAKYLLQESFGHEAREETEVDSGGVVILSEIDV